MLTRQDIRRAVESSARMSVLPGVPTTDWCDRAAEALMPPPDHEAAIVAIAERTIDSVRIIEPARHIRFAREHALWRSLDALPLADTDTGVLSVHVHHGTTTQVRALAPVGGPRESGHGLWIIGAVELIAPPDAAVERESVILEELMPRLAERCAVAFSETSPNRLALITPAEQRILEHLMLGRSVSEIAEILVRSPHTIHDHVKSLHRKFGATSRGQLVARALGYAEQTAHHS